MFEEDLHMTQVDAGHYRRFAPLERRFRLIVALVRSKNESPVLYAYGALKKQSGSKR